MLLYLCSRGHRKPIESVDIKLLRSCTDSIVAQFASRYNPEAFTVRLELDNKTKMYFVGIYENHAKKTFAFAETPAVALRVFDFFCDDVYFRIGT